MSRNEYGLLGGFVLIVLGFIVWNKWNPRYDWRERYEDDNKEPYNTYVLSRLLKSSFPAQELKVLQKRVHQSLTDSLETNANYLFVGEAVYADSADIDKWLDFASRGNKVFLATEVLPYALFEKIYDNRCGDVWVNSFKWLNSHALSYEDTSVKMNFTHPQLFENKPFTYKYVYDAKPNVTHWHFMDTFPSSCAHTEQNMIALGTFNKKYVNFSKIDYGKGSFYFHTNPIIFTNYFLLDSNHLRYTSKVLGHLSEGRIYWDPTSRIPAATGRRMNHKKDRSGGSNRQFDKDSPLKYILSQPSLAWGWYLFLSGILLYMIFAAKRVQRIIPVLPPKSNDSLGFIKTIGKIYFKENDYIKLCSEMMHYFQTFVRERYRISGHFWEKDGQGLQMMMSKSGVEPQIVRSILDFERKISARAIVESDALELYQLLKIFYKNCK